MTSASGTGPRIAALRDAADAEEYGLKAAPLAAVAAAGLPVPDAFCLPADAYREHIARPDVADPIALLGAIAADEPRLALTSQLQRVRSAIVRAPLDPALLATVHEAFGALGDGPVSVRSSLTRDDRGPRSFAPSHGTYFAPDRDAAERNIQHCWAAMWTDWAWARRRPGDDLAEPACATIVQRLVPAVASGVAFTADPTTGDDDRIVIEACHGLGEAIQSAKVDPDRYVLSAAGLEPLEEHLGEKSRELVVREDGSIAEQSVEPSRAWRAALGHAGLAAVAGLALRAAGVLGAPAAVEFALAKDGAWVLQARPIVFA